MATTVNTQIANLPLHRANFTWTPVGAPISYTFTGNTYPPVSGARFDAFFTPVNQLLTFTASVTPAPGTNIVLYRWDMGDGNVKFGSTIGHTYTVPNQNLTCKLTVTDNLNRSIYVSKVMLLQVQFPTAVQDHVRV